ncbi:MAG TPA: DUF2784 domain-containing protein [Pseudonocardiaceae bacterium]|jgi:hypothetical protein|nr:DUF2784 domain-containing protein [Pseudonocardiaceae bacterium]
MVDRLLDDLTVAVHYLVMAYIVFGGFITWKWRWTAVPHAMFIVWAVISLLYPVSCPLTLAEDYFRQQGGLPKLNGGFIDTYITGVFYPAQYVLLVQVLAGAFVVASWAGLYVLHVRHLRQRSQPIDSVDNLKMS